MWAQFLVNIDVDAIHNESGGANNFKKLLTNVVHIGIWALNFYELKNAQVIFFNLNNDLYMINLNVLTLSGWNVATSIDLN